MERSLRGIGVSPGVAVGPVYVMPESTTDAVPALSSEEWLRSLDAALGESVAQLEEIAARLRAQGLEDEAGIMEAQVLMLQDPSLLDLIRHGMASGQPGVQAVHAAVDSFRSSLEALEDPYLAARAADVQDVGERLSRRLLHRAEPPPLRRPSVVVAHSLTPSQTASLERDLVLGFIAESGTAMSHAAILARALNIPAVVGVEGITTQVRDGGEVALDGGTGAVVVNPTPSQRTTYASRLSAQESEQRQRKASRDAPAQTRDGHRLVLAANIGSLDDVPAALEVRAEGIGLFRTELLFAGRAQMPSEEEQVEAYRSVLSLMAPHTVVIRTLDIGGDKPLPYLPQRKEMNPFLGERGIRYALARPQILHMQFRALLRASSTGRLAVMVPMVSDREQIERVRASLQGARDEVGGDAELGIMIEVPAAALIAEQLARHVSFFSVGSNDLVQYALAADRGNERVASLYRPLHPGILRLLQVTVDGAHAHGRWVGICGEIAGDELVIPILLGLGFDELSMAPGRIPAARERIRGLELTACRELALRALTCETAGEVERLVHDQARIAYERPSRP